MSTAQCSMHLKKVASLGFSTLVPSIIIMTTCKHEATGTIATLTCSFRSSRSSRLVGGNGCTMLPITACTTMSIMSNQTHIVSSVGCEVIYSVVVLICNATLNNCAIYPNSETKALRILVGPFGQD